MSFNFLIIVGITVFLPRPRWIKALVVLVGAEAILTWVPRIFVNVTYVHEVTKYEAIARIVERFWAFFVGDCHLSL